jgi:hypothetical protein
MLELIGTVVTSILGGGATGLFGVLIQRWADYKNRQQDLELQKLKFDHEGNMKDKDAAIMAQEWAARTKVADIEATARVGEATVKAVGEEAVADANAFAASFKMEPARWSEGVKPTRAQGWLLLLLDAFRAVIRPGLTLYLCYLVTQVYNESRKYGNTMTPEQAFDILKLLIGTIVYLWTTCTLWWFGTRNKGQAPKSSN